MHSAFGPRAAARKKERADLWPALVVLIRRMGTVRTGSWSYPLPRTLMR